MAYDEELADRIRELLGARPGVTEKKMFGGLGFLVRSYRRVERWIWLGEGVSALWRLDR